MDFSFLGHKLQEGVQFVQLFFFLIFVYCCLPAHGTVASIWQAFIKSLLSYAKINKSVYVTGIALLKKLLEKSGKGVMPHVDR